MPFNPRKLRPHHDWAVLLEEQRKTKLASGIILTDQLAHIENVHECAGEVISIGQSPKFARIGVKAGSRVGYRGFLKYAHPLETDEKWPDGTTKKFFLIKLDDICFTLGKNVDVGAFSARSPISNTSTK